MNRFPYFFATAALTLLMLPLSARAEACVILETDGPQTAAPQTADAGYAAGTRAMNESRWSDAVAGFDQVINAKGSRVDAALYWKAYSLNKLGKADLAKVTCGQLRAQFAESRWNRDCLALSLTQTSAIVRRGPSGQDGDPYHFDFDFDFDSHQSKDPDVEIKILAMNSLLHRDPAQAIPLLRGILAGDQPASLKQHALFVVTQSKSPEADALMHDLIMGKMGPDLQRQSIQASGVYRGRRSDDVLVEAYRSTADAKVKRSVISALFVANDDTHLVELAKAEKDLQLKRSIVSQLALMKGQAAQDYMLELLK